MTPVNSAPTFPKDHAEVRETSFVGRREDLLLSLSAMPLHVCSMKPAGEEHPELLADSYFTAYRVPTLVGFFHSARHFKQRC